MHSSPGSGRVLLLAVLLLATCYFADWTGDYRDFAIANKYSMFQSANGHLSPRGGTAGGGGSALLAIAMQTKAAGAQRPSAIEAVFGSPIGPDNTTTGEGSLGRLNGSSASLGNPTTSTVDLRAVDSGRYPYSGSSNLGLGSGSSLGLTTGTPGFGAAQSLGISPY